ncbi:hypothetical protein [Kribbella sp. NPDC004536]|uniref:hypothetical protein n=1 Tax=Kribbella sp. NPDC004536 TaxID=3364106 RepID=UPI0036B8096E
MTHTLTRPITAPPRWHRSLVYDVLLVPVGVLTLADAVLGEPETAARRWRRLGEYRVGRSEVRPMTTARTFGYGLLSAVLGLASLFVLFLTVLAVIRGPFWGFVEHGAVEPGTWGGPSRAGAWLAHGLIALPCIVAFVFVLRGIAALHTLLLQGTRSWVLPATIVLAAGTCAFFRAWLQQV